MQRKCCLVVFPGTASPLNVARKEATTMVVLMHAAIDQAPTKPETCRRMRVTLASFVVCFFACGGSAADPQGQNAVLGQNSAELATLEIRDDNIDLFTDCPPPGEIGQNWFPAPSEWRSPSAAQAESGSPEPARNDSPSAEPLASARELVD